MTTIEGARDGEARLFYNLGRHATQDLSSHLAVGSESPAPGIERAEFETACDRLVHAGYTLHERTAAWERFSRLRGTYAPQLNALARFFDIPPLQWIGDRGPVTGPH